MINRSLALAGLLAFSCASHALQGFFGSGESDAPSLSIASTEIAMDVPVPMQGENLALLLAQAGQGGGLSELKESSVRKFSDYLRGELDTQLREHFDDEAVPLVEQKGFFTLRNFLDITVSKQLTDLRNASSYELERGTVELSGDFHYRLENVAGEAVREQRVDIAELRVREKYRVKTATDDAKSEDNTDEAIERALAQLVKRLLNRIEDNLEADELRKMAGR
jgi:hypothetical protein